MLKFWKSRWQQFIAFLKKTSLPGFDGIPIYDVIAFFWQELLRDQIGLRASAISFNFLLAIFPSIIFLFSLIAYIPVSNLNTYIFNTLQDVLPENGYEFLRSTIDDIISIKRGGLLSFGFLLIFYFSTNGVMALLGAFNKKHENYRKRGYWRRRVAAFRLTLYLFLLFLVSMFLIIAGDHIMGIIGDRIGLTNSTGVVLLTIFQWTMIILLYFLGISLIYFYGPAIKKRWRFITPGGTFATILSILASLGFAFFVNNFGTYNEVYGSIGTLIVLMVWLNINSVVLLVGFELNNSIAVNRHLRRKLAEEEDVSGDI